MKNELLIFGEIPFEQNAVNSPLWVRNRLSKMNFADHPELTVKINSEGGDVDNGFAIYYALREVAEAGINVTTEIAGRCASIATIIFLAGDYRIGNKYFAPFTHSAYVSPKKVNQHEARMIAEELTNIDNRIAEFYADVTKGTKAQYLEMMKNETSIDAHTALELRFFHEIKKIKNPKNMNFLQSIKNKLSPLFGVKNLMFYTADQKEVFIDTESAVPVVGDTVKIDGQTPEDGEYLMESGETWVIAGGQLAEIKEQEAEVMNKEDEPTEDQKAMNEIAEGMAALNAKFEELSAKNTALSDDNAELKATIETISNKLVDADKAIKAFKNLKGETVEDKKADEPKATSALDKYRK